MNIFFALCTRRIFNRKNVFLTILLFFLISIFLFPVKKFSIIAKHPSSPWILPFLLTDTNFLILFMAAVIIFFSNVPFMKRWNCYYLLRSGKEKWIKEQIAYIVISALVITGVSIVLTWIALFPNVKMEYEWGSVIYTLSQTDASEMCDLFWQISAQFISKHSALGAMGLCIVIMILGITFIGMLMFWGSIFLSRIFSIIIAISFVVYTHMITALGDSMQKKLALISPISWMRIADYDVNRYGYKISPSVPYVICAYVILISTLMYLVWRKLKRMDFIWNDEEE